jgi:nitroreductase
LVFCSPSLPRRFFVDDRKSHEHSVNHLRLGDFTVRLRFGCTVQDPPDTQLLLTNRWSPRAMSGEEISHEELMRLFEAARWAPSSFNAQPWRALYARRGTEHWQTFFDLLVDANKVWAKNAAVLVVFISRKNIERNDEPSVTHSYDCGAAWENFALQGSQQGLVVHGRQGFDYDRAHKDLRIPDDFQIEAMAAVGSRVRKNCFLRNCKSAKPRTIDGKLPRAFSKGRLKLNNSGHS